MDEHQAHAQAVSRGGRRRRMTRSVPVAALLSLAVGAPAVSATPGTSTPSATSATSATSAAAPAPAGAASSPAVARPAAPRATVTFPRGVALGGTGAVTVRVTPPSPGRVVSLQRLAASGLFDRDWTTVATAKQDRRGRAVFTVTRPADLTTYRAVVAPAGASTGVAGPSATWLTPGLVAPVRIGAAPNETVYGMDWAANDTVSYARDAQGRLVVAAREESANALLVDVLDPHTGRSVERRRTISLAGWTEWGGVHTTPDGDHWVLLGRRNEKERHDLDVVEVRRYSADWRPLGSAHVKGGAAQSFTGIETPFLAGAAHVVRAGHTLVVHMSRRMFIHQDGLRHQSNLTFEVDVPTMTTRTFDEIGGSPYVSHSFQSLVTRHGNDLVFVDHGDAYPRAVVMHVIRDAPTRRTVTEHEVMTFRGTVGDNVTGAAVTGLVDGPSGVLIAGNSVRQQEPWNPEEHRNVFLIAARPSDGSSTTTWLSAVAAAGKDVVGEPRLVPVGADRFAVLFDVERRGTHRLEYRLVDSAGTVHATASLPGVLFTSGGEPLLLGSRLVWLGRPSGTDDVYLTALDVTDPTRPVPARQ